MGSSPQSLRSPSPFPAFAYSRTKRHLLFFGGAGGSSSGGGSAGVAVRWAVFECADALRRGREKWRTSDSPAALVEARSPTVLLPLHCHALRRRWTAVFYETRGSFDPKVFGKRQYPPRSPIRFVIVPPFLEHTHARPFPDDVLAHLEIFARNRRQAYFRPLPSFAHRTRASRHCPCRDHSTSGEGRARTRGSSRAPTC